MLKILSCAAVVLASVSAHATPFTITYTGTVNAFYLNPDYNGDNARFIDFGGAATETYLFNTDDLVISANRYTVNRAWEPAIGSALVITGGPGGFIFGYGGTLDMSFAGGDWMINSIWAGPDGYSNMNIRNGLGTFQQGTCPSFRPSCGSFTPTSFTIDGLPAPVPGPTAGGFTIAGILGLFR